MTLTNKQTAPINRLIPQNPKNNNFKIEQARLFFSKIANTKIKIENQSDDITILLTNQPLAISYNQDSEVGF